MKTAAPSLINSTSLKHAYISACRARSIKPRRAGFNNFVQLIESDAKYWMNANLKFFFESMNY